MFRFAIVEHFIVITIFALPSLAKGLQQVAIMPSTRAMKRAMTTAPLSGKRPKAAAASEDSTPVTKRASSIKPRKGPKLAASLDDASEGEMVKIILQGLHAKADKKTKDWFTNYVKGSEWIGCKTPVVREVVLSTKKNLAASRDHAKTNNVIIGTGISLLQNTACDAKLAGMIMLSEILPKQELASHTMLDRFDQEVWSSPEHINDWSTADWFALRVLKPIVFHVPKKGEGVDASIVRRVMAYTQLKEGSLWQRRCGVVPFLQYPKHRSKLPAEFGSELVAACETSLQISSQERFTQTGIAWVLRYMILEAEEREESLHMIYRNGSLWNKEAKRSITEKLGKTDPVRKKIMALS